MRSLAIRGCNLASLAGELEIDLSRALGAVVLGSDPSCGEPTWARTSLVGGAGERDLSRIVPTWARTELAGGAAQHADLSCGVPTWVRQGASR